MPPSRSSPTVWRARSPRPRRSRGDRTVAVASADIAQQCLNLGLLDAITVELVPVLLGSGTPFFANLQQPVALGTPSVIEGHGVTHLRYRVQDKA